MSVRKFFSRFSEAASQSTGGYGYEPYLSFRGKFEDIHEVVCHREAHAEEPASSES